MLNLEVTPGGLNFNEHTAIHWYPADAPMSAAKHSAYRPPLTLHDRFETSEVNVGERRPDVLENSEHSCPTYRAAMIACVLGEEACGRIHVASVECIPVALNVGAEVLNTNVHVENAETLRINERPRSG